MAGRKQNTIHKAAEQQAETLNCGSESAMALAPSAPILLSQRLRLVNDLLKKRTMRQNQTELSQYASNQHETKSSMKLNSRRMHLRLRERVGNGLGAASPDLVAAEIEAGQRPVEQSNKRTKSDRTQSVCVRSTQNKEQYEDQHQANALTTAEASRRWPGRRQPRSRSGRDRGWSTPC